MPEHIVFLTGKLAESNLRGELADLAANEFTYDVVRLPINVAGLMTADFIGRHFSRVDGAGRVIVPGRCRSDLDAVGLEISRTIAAVSAKASTCRCTTCRSSPRSSMRRT